jgi:hypothetical protein
MALITPKINGSSITSGTIANTRLQTGGSGPYEFIAEKIWASNGQHDSDTYARIFFTNIFDKTKYSGYKVIFHWLGYEAQGNVLLRMQTGTAADTTGQRNGAYYYGNNVYMDSQSTTYYNERHEASNQGTLFSNVWPHDRGGLTGEFNITHVAHSPTASKVDDHFRPYIYGTFVGYYVGVQYRRVDIQSRCNESQNGDFYTGFQLFNSVATSVSQGSHISVYGIKWSTT